MKIDQSIILITSAGSTLGNSLANHLIQLGAKLILCDDNQYALEQTYKNCRQHSPHVCQFYLQEQHSNAIEDVFNLAKQQFSQTPNVLINHWCSTPMPMVTSHLPAQPFIDQLSLMANNLFSFSQHCSQRMLKAAQEGVIVNIISHPEEANLSGAENATSIISSFTHTWAKELSEHNIRVGGVVPEIRHLPHHANDREWIEVNDELIRNTEYIITNDFFNGRVMTAQV